MRKPLFMLLTATLVTACGLGRVRTPEIRHYESQGNELPGIGAARLAFGDFDALQLGTLDSHALPWKLSATALLLHERPDGPMNRAALHELLKSFGFIRPAAVENWPAALDPPGLKRPLGINTGTFGLRPLGLKLEIANVSCSACHAGVLYDAHGSPVNRAWLGAPNTSIDLEQYTVAVYESLGHALALPDAELMEAVQRLFPDTGAGERWILRRFAIPEARQRLQELAGGVNAPMPFSNGGPGYTNGIAAMKLQLGLLSRDRNWHPEYGFTSIPTLGATWLRSSLLYDGVYAPPGQMRQRVLAAGALPERHVQRLAAITAYFTISTMGLEPEESAELIDRTRDVFAFLQASGPPPFPGTIDEVLASAGAAVYAQRCAGCHGRYERTADGVELVEFPNRLVPQDEINTDPARWQAFDDRLLEYIAGSAIGRHIAAQRTGGYVAPALSGIWVSAPYLHNGSVPTMQQLFNPEERAERFMAGGHRLDFEALGIAGTTGADGVFRYPPGYEPWSVPQLYDTNLPGRSNRGHERQFEGLDAQEQRALIEYLKQL